MNKSRLSYLKPREFSPREGDSDDPDVSNLHSPGMYSVRDQLMSSKKKINESMRYQGMLNMSGMSGEGLGMSGMSPLGFNKSIYPD